MYGQARRSQKRCRFGCFEAAPTITKTGDVRTKAVGKRCRDAAAADTDLAATAPCPERTIRTRTASPTGRFEPIRWREAPTRRAGRARHQFLQRRRSRSATATATKRTGRSGRWQERRPCRRRGRIRMQKHGRRATGPVGEVARAEREAAKGRRAGRFGNRGRRRGWSRWEFDQSAPGCERGSRAVQVR